MNMFDYQEAINRLRVSISGYDKKKDKMWIYTEGQVVDHINKIVKVDGISPHKVISICMDAARIGKPMPWEKEY